jgi:hypothetical protein
VLFCACTSLDLLSFFNWLRITKNLPFFYFSECELKLWFPKVHCFWWFPNHTYMYSVRVTHSRRTSVFAVRIHHFDPWHHNLPSATDHIWQDYELTDIGSPSKLYSHLFVIHSTSTPMTSHTVPVPKFVLTPAMKVAVYPSEEQPPTNLTYVIKSTNAFA